MQEFPFGHPAFKCNINKIYNSSFSGSNLWDFTSHHFEMLVNSWSVSVRHMWNLPRESHRYFMEPLGGTHATVMIYTRFIKFIQNIQNKCTKNSAKYLLELIKNDTKTITGRNLRKISDEANNYKILESDINQLKKDLKFEKVTDENIWKINMIKELVQVKHNEMTIQFFDEILWKAVRDKS